jgi:DNA-binding protein H-NS
MASTYQALTREIEALKKKAETARKQEAAELVALIRNGIELYGLTAEDLGLDSAASTARTAKKAATSPKVKTAATASSVPAAKYVDDAGHAWSGRGPKPGWVKAALDAGHTLDDLLATAKPKSAASSKGAAKSSKAGGKKATRNAVQPATSAANKPAKKSSKAAAVETAVQPSATVSVARYKDDAGNSWSGRGPKPGWLRVALEAGKSLEDFLA